MLLSENVKYIQGFHIGFTLYMAYGPYHTAVHVVHFTPHVVCCTMFIAAAPIIAMYA